MAKFARAGVFGAGLRPYRGLTMAFIPARIGQLSAWGMLDGHWGWHHGYCWTWAPLAMGGSDRGGRFIVRPRWRAPLISDPARTILAEHYARGEITPEEYRERLETLKQTKAV